MTIKEELEILSNNKDIYLKEIGEINRKYNFSSIGRNQEDKDRSKILWDTLRQMDAVFDIKNPAGICELCGCEKTYILNDGNCINIGKCKAAARFMGG